MGVKIFFLLTNFAQCSSSRSLTPEKWDVRTWNVEQIFGLSHGWLVSNIVDVYIKCCSQNLCIKNSSSSSQCRSLHSFPISLFICHCFGYRLLLQTCDRDCFRAFAHRHALPLEAEQAPTSWTGRPFRSATRSCCARDSILNMHFCCDTLFYHYLFVSNLFLVPCYLIFTFVFRAQWMIERLS